MEKKKCNNCNHEWIPRLENPRECPKCKSYLWNRKIDFKSIRKCEVCKRHFHKLVCHHIDGNPKDNSPSNMIFICEDCHKYIHIKERKKGEGKNKHRIRIRDYYKPSFKSIREKLEKYRKIWLSNIKK